MAGVCKGKRNDCRCPNCRKAHDAIEENKTEENTFKWVDSSVTNQGQATKVNGEVISRRSEFKTGDDKKTFVGPISKNTSGRRQILINLDPARETWKKFTSDFNPRRMNAVRACHGIESWSGSEVYIGKVSNKDKATIVTIYYVGDENEGNYELDIPNGFETPELQVLCEA